MAKKTLMLCAALALYVPMAQADSIMPDTGVTSPYGKAKALNVGDVITVLIVESAKAEQEASIRTEKDSMNSIGAGTGFFNSTFNLPVEKFGVGSNKFHQGGGRSRRRGSFTATITAKVSQVLPNGNLMIKGVRYLELNDEIQSIEVEGEIRPADISQDNMVLSSSVGNARIRYKGQGPLSESAKPGFLSRLLDWLWIF